MIFKFKLNCYSKAYLVLITNSNGGSNSFGGTEDCFPFSNNYLERQRKYHNMTHDVHSCILVYIIILQDYYTVKYMYMYYSTMSN